MATIFDSSKYILESFPYGISTSKLQHLNFLAQGWTLAILNEPLFNDSFQAWACGPISPDLLNSQKDLFSVKADDLMKGSTESLSQKQKTILDTVVHVYGNLTGDQIAELYARNRMWREARQESKHIVHREDSKAIDIDWIKHYFREIIEPEHDKKEAISA